MKGKCSSENLQLYATMSVDVWCKGSGDEQMQDVIVEEDAVRFCRVTTEEGGGGGGPGSTGGPITMDKDEKRMRREIANSNERRRMQSINAGFQSLRQMLPHHEGEKLSKVSAFWRVMDGNLI